MAEYTVLFDAYQVGDRLLDGVDFEVKISGDPAVKLVVDSVDVTGLGVTYFESANFAPGVWEAKAKAQVEQDLAEMIRAGCADEVLTEADSQHDHYAW